jgi:hypothetical protein
MRSADHVMIIALIVWVEVKEITSDDDLENGVATENGFLERRFHLGLITKTGCAVGPCCSKMVA